VAAHATALLAVEVPQINGRARCDTGLDARAEACHAERQLRGDFPQRADPLLYDRDALAFGHETGLAIE